MDTAVAANETVSGGGLWLPAVSLARREVVRFLRQRSRVISVLATPLVFWILLGAGMGKSFQAGAANTGFLEYFFPGIIVLTVMFSAIFSTISIIEDRTTGFLQSVLVAPVPRLAIILGKVLGGTALALFQGALLLLLTRLAGIPIGFGGLLLTMFWLALISMSLTGLGCILAWVMDSVQGFHAVMNLFLMPLWMLSGAFYPASGAHWSVKIVMYLNPLYYGMAGVRKAMYAGASTAQSDLPNTFLSLLITAGFAALTFWYASTLAAKKEK